MDSIDTAKTASRTEGDGRLAAGRSATGAVGELQVGYQDPSMGYVELRAHADGSGIHASLGAQTPAAGETLEGHLSSLAGWMNERHTPVESLTVLMPASQANAQPDFRGKESEAQSLADGMGSGGDVGTGGGHAQDGGRGNEDAASGGWPRTSSLAESDSAAAPAPASRWGGGWGVAPVPPGAGSISVLA